jgi:hypothetical protein
MAGFASLPAADIPAPPIRDDQVGVCAHFDQGWSVPDMMPMIGDLGVGWIRDGVAWTEMEPTKRHYVVPAKLAAWLDAAHDQQLKVLLLLGYGNKAYKDPFSPRAYARAAAFLATRLKDRINAIEVLNEPNNPDFGPTYGGKWNGKEDDGSVSPYVRAYVKVLTATVAAVKRANPEMLVVGYGAPAPATFRMIALGAPADLDGITDHPYSGGATLPELVPYAATPDLVKRDGIATADVEGTYASQCAMFRKWAVRHGLRPALWNTEWGFSTTQSPAHPELNLSQETQAVYILRRLLETRALGVRSFYYVFRDDGGDVRQDWQNFGLVDIQLKKKQGFFAFRRFTRAFAGVTGNKTPEGFALDLDGASPGRLGDRCYAYRAASSSEKWVACWKVEPWPSADAAQPVKLEFPPGDKSVRAVGTNFLTGEERPLAIASDPQGRRFISLPLDGNPCVIHLFN